MLVQKENDPFLRECIISPRGGSSILKECIIRKVKFFDLQIWANLQILEVKTIIRGLFPGNIVLLPLMGKPVCSFALTKHAKTTFERVTF